MSRFARENGLSLFFAAIFLATLVGQSFAGQHNFNAEQVAHGQQTLSWWHYVVTPSFGGAVMENWQSEFLQFSLFIAATIWLVQKGSNESKKLDSVGLEGDEQQKIGLHAPPRAPRWAKADDIRTRIYENSLLIVMTLIFFATWFGQSLNNWRVFNQEQAVHNGARVSWDRYLLDPGFWEKTLQNWQSEFLAVGTMVVFTIYLRQRGSPESKPVGAPHDETATNLSNTIHRFYNRSWISNNFIPTFPFVFHTDEPNIEPYYVLKQGLTVQLYTWSLQIGLPLYTTLDTYIFMISFILMPKIFYSIYTNTLLKEKIWDILWFPDENNLMYNKIYELIKTPVTITFDTVFDLIKNIKLKCNITNLLLDNLLTL